MDEPSNIEKYVRHVLRLKAHLSVEDMQAIGVLYESLIELEKENERLRADNERLRALLTQCAYDLSAEHMDHRTALEALAFLADEGQSQ